MKLAKKSVCTGCQACSNLCTQNAIKMKMNEEGFFFPRIDGNYCIKCENVFRFVRKYAMINVKID